jgi:2-alkyl-3-oxoalkanoate reductase
MKLLVTGASGFLGRFVVAEAVSHGHYVRALVRAASAPSATTHGVEFVQGDLRGRRGLVDIVRGCDVVIHLAAAKAGDLYTQMGGTVVATENLLAAMDEAGVTNIVHISSFAVYDFINIRHRSILDENSPLADFMGDRDDYAITKLLQEKLVIEHAQKNNWRWTVLRPGMLYGQGNLFNARVGLKAGGNRWLRTGASADIPLNYVENCAQAIVLAAEKSEANGQIFNVVDDDPPTQRKYADLIAQRTTPPPKIVPVPWTIMRLIAGAASWVNHSLLSDRAKIPGIFIPSRLHARCRPLKYSNDKIKSVLGWSPRYGLLAALDRSAGGPS